MRRVGKIAGTLALTLTLAMSAMQTQTVFAADGDQAVSVDVNQTSDNSQDTSTDGDTKSSTDDTTTPSTDDTTTSSTDDTTTPSTDDTTAVDDTASSIDDTTAVDDTASSIDDTTAVDDTTTPSTDDVTPSSTDDATTQSTDDAATPLTDDTTASLTTYADDNQDTNPVALEDAIVYLTDNDGNYYDTIDNKATITLTGTLGEEVSKIFKFNFIGATTTGIAHEKDLTDWCTGMPDSFSLIKYTGNLHVNYGRVQVIGTTTSNGKYEVKLTIPQNYFTIDNGYKVSADGLTTTFFLDFGELVVPVTVPTKQVEEARHSSHHSSTPKVVVSEYTQFCNEVAGKIMNAKENEEVQVTTDKWVSFNKKVVDALDARKDVTLKLDFKYQDQAYQTVINPGAAEQLMITKTYSLDTNTQNGEVGAPVETVAAATEAPEYYGFLFVGSKFGMNTVTE